MHMSVPPAPRCAVADTEADGLKFFRRQRLELLLEAILRREIPVPKPFVVITAFGCDSGYWFL